MATFDIRQDKPYRRGLILGLTLAEIMILLIFVLLMALASSLAARDRRLQVLDTVVSTRLVEKITQAYPDSRTPDEYFKELVRAIDADRLWGQAQPRTLDESLLADALLGRKIRDAAGQSSAADAEAFLDRVLEQEAGRKKTETPPFFNLSEAGGYYFDTGKATLRPEVQRRLEQEIVPRLQRMVSEYDVDVVEVVGHTDEVPMTGTTNLDWHLIDASASRFGIAGLSTSDNAGLAMARAVSVVSLLRSAEALQGVTILPLSAAQMILPGDRLADGNATQGDQSRRRIEIRLRRKSGQVAGV